MNLYLISQDDDNVDYDTYDSAVVAAPDEETARNTHPSGINNYWSKYPYFWCNSPNDVKVELIGIARDDMEQGVVISSYNAG